MRRIGITSLVVLAWIASAAPAAHAQRTARPVRVGNVNQLTFGVGHPSFDHPNFDDQLFWNLDYQHRIFRREMRRIPIWLRGAVGFMAEDRKILGYTVYRSEDQTHFKDTVTEHMSDFAVRFEAIADLLRTSNLALYAGGGFALHALTFNSDGPMTGFAPFKSTQNEMGPSLAAGVRWFAARRTPVVYAEVRYGLVYGRNDPVGVEYLTDQTFAFTHVSAVSVEGGVGLHW